MTDAAAVTSFLFTDIEGSSLKWLNHRAAMQAALADHDRILRAAIAANGGEVFKTAGDAFLAAFKRPSDAVNAAIAAQRSLAAHDWSSVAGLKVRMAVHCGTAEKRDGDYFGPALNRCARLLSLAHGGQVLATSTSAELLSAEREVKEPLRLIGTHPLDDPAQSVAIHQVLVAGLPQDFPPLRTPQTRPTNLPRHLTSLIGRQSEIDAIKAMIAANRLVTLTGPGGVGKTRLAIETGLDLLPRFTHGVWLVELAPLNDPALVVSAVGTALLLDLSGNRPPRDILISHLQTQDILVVLDNCEHVVDAVAALVEAVLGGAPGVRILVSSQELIGLPGEQVLRVPPLDVPDAASPVAQDAVKAGAVQLFVERVKAANPKFAFGDKAALVVSAICRRLDGVPLAIEMAAARAPMLGLEPLLQGLDARFRILTGGKRTALPRQRTLHAALDWSHALLTDNDRIVFRRVGAFAGGFTLTAATAVAGDDALKDFEVVDCLADLVAKSLVAADTTSSGTRYRLLETMRAYALEKLGEAGETDAVARRHATYFRGLVEKSFEGSFTLPTIEWRNLYPSELDNVRTALDWSFAPSGDAELAIALAAGSHHLFDYLSLFDEIKKWLALAEAKLSPRASRALETGLRCAMAVNMLHGGYIPTDETVAALEHAAERCREPREELLLGRVLALLGLARANRRETSHLELVLTEAKPILEQNPFGRAWYQLLCGMLKAAQGELPEARRFVEVAIGVARDAGNLGTQNFAELISAMYALRAGNHALAIDLLRDLRDRIRQSPFADMRRLAGANGMLGLALAEIGEHDEALTLMRETISMARRIGIVFVFIDGFVLNTALAGRYENAVRLAGWSDQHFGKAAEGRFNMTRLLLRARANAILSANLHAAEIERLMAEGAQMSEDEACKLAAQG
jgi:predicted ATPase/class 3 adenylate cyclase